MIWPNVTSQRFAVWSDKNDKKRWKKYWRWYKTYITSSINNSKRSKKSKSKETDRKHCLLPRDKIHSPSQSPQQLLTGVTGSPSTPEGTILYMPDSAKPSSNSWLQFWGTLQSEKMGWTCKMVGGGEECSLLQMGKTCDWKLIFFQSKRNNGSGSGSQTVSLDPQKNAWTRLNNRNNPALWATSYPILSQHQWSPTTKFSMPIHGKG